MFLLSLSWLVSSGVEKIPTACITVEDAEMMARMAARGTKIVINLKMAAKTLPPVVSRNTVAEIKGSVYPEQVHAFLLKSSKLIRLTSKLMLSYCEL